MHARVAFVPTLLLLALCASAPAGAAGWTATVHVAQVEVDRVVRDDGLWWAGIDDRTSALGLSLTYRVMPTVGLRLMHERASDLRAINICPPGAACPAVAFREDTDLNTSHALGVAHFPISPAWSMHGMAGVTHWRLSPGPQLPRDSGTDFSYGLGLTWHLALFEFGVEYQRAGVDYDALRLNVGFRFP